MPRPYLDPAPLPGPDQWPDDDLVGVTVGMDPVVTLRAYVNGMFPMPLSETIVAHLPPVPWTGWFSPLRRGILPLDELRVSRSLRKMSRRYTVTVDQAFEEVILRCADPEREGGWIDESVLETYTFLHSVGRTHSVEVWTAAGELAGGLYGFAYGGLFAGESMFHDPRIGRDASKVALMALVAMLRASDPDRRLLDVQWATDHLRTLGVSEIDRDEYLRRLAKAVEVSPPRWEIPPDWRDADRHVVPAVPRSPRLSSAHIFE